MLEIEDGAGRILKDMLIGMRKNKRFSYKRL
jgi:hypothetical protein